MRAAPDPGLQGERTALAWSRTGLALCANALLALRAGIAARHGLTTALGAALLLAAACTVLVGVMRRRQLVHRHVRMVPPAVLLGVAAAGFLAGITALVSLSASR